MNCYWIENSEYDIEDLIKTTGSVAVLPLASIESHGPHLPLGSDIILIKEVLSRVVEREKVAVLPVLPYSYVAEARRLPGAVHTPSHLLMDLVEKICDEAYRNGFNKIVLIHGHGGNPTLHEAFVKRMLEREKPYALYSISALCNIGDKIKDMLESKVWGHAGEMETSLLLVAAPELVNLKRLGGKKLPALEGPQVFPALTPVESPARYPAMARGEPQKATKEKGEKILSLWAEEIVKTLGKIKKDKVTLAAMQEYSSKANSLRNKGVK